MENSKSGSPITDGNFILGKINNLKVEQEEDGINCTLERMDIKTEQDEFKHADSSDEQEAKKRTSLATTLANIYLQKMMIMDLFFLSIVVRCMM